MSGEKPAALEFEEPEESVIFVMDYFWSIRSASVDKITYNDLKAFQDCMNIHLCSWQCEAIIKIDNIYAGSVYG